jgi:TPR repeat protein
VIRAALLSAALAAPAVASTPADALALWRAGDAHGAYRVLRAISADGAPEADALLGFMTLRGAGVRADPAVAAGWWTRAARRGNGAAQLALADAYARGRGVPQDLPQALVLAQRAAAQDQPGAKRYLARLRSQAGR